MTLKKFLFALLAFSLSLVSCKIGKQIVADAASQETGVVKYATVPDITENDIHLHISVLASDSMNGRKTGTPYEALAAGYIREKFKSLGLKAFGDNFFQLFSASSRRYFGNCELYFDGYKADYPEDFRSKIMFDSLSVTGEVVFVGYGFESDYGNLDVKDKWVMLFEKKNSILYDRKATAKSKGASGVLAIGIDGTSGGERHILPSDSIPIITISNNLADHLFAHAGTTVSEVLAKITMEENLSMIIPIMLNATIKTAAQTTLSQNVVACLEANDSGNESEYIVIGAHYDHIGTTTEGDNIQIFNGADDNASGVAGLLEIAEKLSAGATLKYNIIFVAFGAEEMGLVGSRFFCDNPPVSLEKIKTMINLDMIGRMDSTNNVYISTVNPADNLNIVLDEIKMRHPDINVDIALDKYLLSSDHSSFHKKQIPAISFTTGLHDAYHTPADTTEAINFRGEKLVLDFIYEYILKEAGR